MFNPKGENVRATSGGKFENCSWKTKLTPGELVREKTASEI
jgi:hypothetical protein